MTIVLNLLNGSLAKGTSKGGTTSSLGKNFSSVPVTYREGPVPTPSQSRPSDSKYPVISIKMLPGGPFN